MEEEKGGEDILWLTLFIIPTQSEMFISLSSQGNFKV
jgi:hypothetical protein